MTQQVLVEIPETGTPRVAPGRVGMARTGRGVTASVDALAPEIRAHLNAALADCEVAERLTTASRRDLAAALTRARDAGAQINELARAYGLSKPTIYRLLREHARPA